MIHKKSKFITFTDGAMASYKVVDRHLIETKQACIHYKTATTGERRFWDAQVAGTFVDMTVYVPYESKIDRGDIAIIGDKQYFVAQKDYKDAVLPMCYLLTLTEATISYNVKEAMSG